MFETLVRNEVVSNGLDFHALSGEVHVIGSCQMMSLRRNQGNVLIRNSFQLVSRSVRLPVVFLITFSSIVILLEDVDL